MCPLPGQWWMSGLSLPENSLQEENSSESRQIQTANSKAQQTFPVSSVNDNSPIADNIPDSQEKETINMRFHFAFLPPVSEVKSFSRVRLFATPWTVAHGLLHPWNSPGKNTGVGCHFLLQGIFPTSCKLNLKSKLSQICITSNVR